MTVNTVYCSFSNSFLLRRAIRLRVKFPCADLEERRLISQLETEPPPRASQMQSKPCSLTKAEYLSLTHQDMGSSFTPQNLSFCLSTDNVQQRDLLFLAPFVEHSAERRSSCCVDQSSFQSKRPIVFNHRDHTQRVHNSRRSRLQGDLIRNLENRHNEIKLTKEKEEIDCLLNQSPKFYNNVLFFSRINNFRSFI